MLAANFVLMPLSALAVATVLWLDEPLKGEGPARATGVKLSVSIRTPDLPAITDIQAFCVRAIPCSAVAQQRHKIIRNGVALAGEESVSVGHQRHPPPDPSGEPTHTHLHHQQ